MGRRPRPRGTLLWLGVLAVVMSRGWLVVPALAALLLAFAGVLPRRPNALLGASLAPSPYRSCCAGPRWASTEPPR